MTHPLVITYDALLKLSQGTTDRDLADHIVSHINSQPNKAQAAADLATATIIAFHQRLTEDHGDEQARQLIEQTYTSLILEDTTGDINDLHNQS
ncbi:hypothetical protein [Leifsonia poae]|uniref:hypothetical protein n=1 Tax=Leifsonia poae TaxID=110933 RepID=UPI003D669A6F